jgi:acyl-CoA synthetase (AMP-forming)/AMP-acid ligase II
MTGLAYGDVALGDRELTTAIDRLAATLTVASGDRVAVVAPNAPALVIGLLATWRRAAVAVPLSTRLRGFELRRAFTDCAPSAAVCVAVHSGFDVGKAIAGIATDVPSMSQTVIVDELGTVVGTDTVGDGIPSPPAPPEQAAIMYTSGTTGEPKGAVLSHTALSAFAESVVELLGDGADATHGLVPPASHTFGLGCLLGAMAAGATTVLIDATTSVGPLLEALRLHRAQLLHGTPALFGRLVRAGAELPVRGGFVAGSACPPAVLETLDDRGVRLLNTYGMSEIGAASSCRADDPPATRYRTAGRALPGYELRERDGQIEVRSAYIADGYHGRPWGPDELTGDGWLRTGDLGRLDPAGNLMIDGRAKEVVQVGGFNVFPAEVESFLVTHPSIGQAAVIGSPHAVLGEALEAFVVPAGDASLTPSDVVRFARAGIAGYKVPYKVHVIGELPLLPSGKPDRRELARRGEREQAVRR